MRESRSHWLRRLLSSGLVLASIGSLAVPAAATDATGSDEVARPNFVIILLDDASWNDFGAYGNEVVKTPVIDQLARDGMRFDNAFVVTSSCSPSRASILTARYPHATGAQVLDQPLPASATILPVELAKAGYYTAAAGKWHLGEPTKRRFDKLYPARDDSGAVDWVQALEDRPRDRPFLLWLAAIDPHRDFTAPAIHQSWEVRLPPQLAKRRKTRKEYAQYYDEIARADTQIGKLLEALKRQGIAENTVVILLADNGAPFPRAKTSLYDSGVRTPLIVRWPARVDAGRVNSQLVSSIDLAPTLLEIAGVAPPAEFQGRSFRASLLDPDVATQEHLILERNAHGAFAFERAVRTRKFLYKQNLYPLGFPCRLFMSSASGAADELVWLYRKEKLAPEQQQCFASPTPLEELYDVERDPRMLENLASLPARLETLVELRRVLAEWSAATGDAIDLSRCDEKDRVRCDEVDAVEARLKLLNERAQRKLPGA